VTDVQSSTVSGTDADGSSEDLTTLDKESYVETESDDASEGSGATGAQERPAGARGRRSTATGEELQHLEEEGEVAADYLEEFLDIADIDGDIDIDVENGRAAVAIVAEQGDRSLRRLVGGDGDVLEALQELTRLAVQASTGERSRLMLDVAGFRADRRRTLEDVAARACQDVQRTGEPVRLEPMTAFERKVVHDAVAEAGLVSESEGEDPGRRVVILPARA
jgi:spoIIIJ-associated protein